MVTTRTATLDLAKACTACTTRQTNSDLTPSSAGLQRRKGVATEPTLLSSLHLSLSSTFTRLIGLRLSPWLRFLYCPFLHVRSSPCRPLCVDLDWLAWIINSFLTLAWMIFWARSRSVLLPALALPQPTVAASLSSPHDARRARTDLRSSGLDLLQSHKVAHW